MRWNRAPRQRLPQFSPSHQLRGTRQRASQSLNFYASLAAHHGLGRCDSGPRSPCLIGACASSGTGTCLVPTAAAPARAFGDEVQDHVGRDRRHHVEPRLAELALDVVLLGEAESRHASARTCRRPPTPPPSPASWPCWPRRRTAGRPRRAPPPCAPSGRPPRSGHRRARSGYCTPWFWPIAPAEQLALLGVVGRLLDEPARIADAFRRRSARARRSCRPGCSGSPALPRRSGSRPALPCCRRTPPVLLWFIMVRIGRIVRPLPSASRMSTRNTDRPSVRFLVCFARRGARQQQHQVGMLGAAGPHLLAVHDVGAVVLLHRRGAQRQRVGAAGRLGDAEGLQAQLAAGDAAAGSAASARRCRAAAACP